MDSFEIRRLQDGGYVVRGGYSPGSGNYCPDLFAATTIEEALRYVKKELKPVND